ncbi:hypothetical protein EOD39_14723 [Acipenser ruthenus]|uniref:Uncharacterized protein n=1 Tax=Acipenser ruthenus TaxID=7906 RepID=A0A662YKD2_ACIRT|nr:hypothetical protein EOD39_14723 [Acipenser ruthenus]
MEDNTIRLRDWILDNAGLEAQSMPIAIRVLWLMDREQWEAYEREHTPNTLEEGKLQQDATLHSMGGGLS